MALFEALDIDSDLLEHQTSIDGPEVECMGTSSESMICRRFTNCVPDNLIPVGWVLRVARRSRLSTLSRRGAKDIVNVMNSPNQPRRQREWAG